MFERAAPWATAALALAGLLAHLGRHAPWGDGPQFLAAAQIAGVVHPTGYPLYSFLTMLAARLAPELNGTPAVVVGVHALSALAMAVAAGLLCGLVQAVGRRLFAPAPAWPDLFAVLGIGAGLTLAWGETAFELGTTAEVYALQVALQLGILRAAVEVAAPRPPDAGRSWPRGRWLLVGALLGGLALAHHRMGVFAVAGLGVATLLWLLDGWRDDRTRARLRTLGGAALLGGAGLLTYIYLPVRAAADPPLNWGAPDSFGRFAWVVRGGEFIQFRLLQEQPGVPFTRASYERFARERLARFVDWAEDQFGELREAQYRAQRLRALGLWTFIALGAAALLAGAWRVALPLGAAAAGYAALPFLYNIYDIEGYMLAVWALLLVCLFVGLGTAWRGAERLLLGRSLHWFPLLLLALPAGVYVTERPRPQWVERLDGAPVERLPAGHDRLPESWATAVLEAVEPGAVVLTEGDNDYFPLVYAQVVLGEGRGVTVVGSNFLKEEWYGRFFERGRAAGDFVPATGGGTPQSARAFFERVAAQAIRPAWDQGRPVYFLTSTPLHYQEYARLGAPVEVARLAEETEALRLRFVLAPPPVVLHRLDPPSSARRADAETSS